MVCQSSNLGSNGTAELEEKPRILMRTPALGVQSEVEKSTAELDLQVATQRND